ncbi:MAG: hypothetical protein OSJ72_03035 [Lachnospiraceae bacterium]|nr:hypothetical protein [Lachnospiraceae bacterium]
MRKRILAFGFCLGIGVAVASCGTGDRSFREQSVSVIQSNQQEATGTQAAEALKEQVLAQMSDEERNWMGGLSKEQRLADFKSLCDGLREHYPYAESAKQQIGADLDALETEYQPNSGLVVQYSLIKDKCFTLY